MSEPERYDRCWKCAAVRPRAERVNAHVPSNRGILQSLADGIAAMAKCGKCGAGPWPAPGEESLIGGGVL